MRFIGDVHGEIEDYLKLVTGTSLQVGDMGVGMEGVFLPKLKGDLFIRGNHDDPNACRQHPNYAGDFGYMGDKEVFFCGGAFSIDVAMRQAIGKRDGKKIWWADEELSIEQLANAYRLYCARKPSIVATHDCPRTASVTLLRRIAIGFRPEKENVTRTGHFLDRMFHFHQPKVWIFGHYHIDADFTIEGTRFICLNTLSHVDIES